MIVNFKAFLVGVSQRENRNNPDRPYFSCNVVQGGDNPISVDVAPELFSVLSEYVRKDLNFTADYVHFYYNQKWITRLVIQDAKPI